MSKLIKEMLDALNAVNQNKTQPFDRQGEVKRIEGKIAWVKLEGSDRETPIQMTIACDVGDTVQARIGGGSAWLTGNLTAPPTDDKKAVEAITMVNNVVQEVQETLEDVSAVDDVSVQYCLSDSSSTFVQYGDWSNTPPTYVSGKYYWTRSVLVDDDGNETYGEPRYSQDTQLSVETDVAFKSNNNHFWHDSSGAYVTTADKSYSTGSAVRITASGILQQVNGSTVSSWTNSGISFLQGGSTVASFGSGGVELYSGGTSVASFGSTARIGVVASDTFNVTIDSNGFYFRENASPIGIVRVSTASDVGHATFLGRDMVTLSTSATSSPYVRVSSSGGVQLGGAVSATGAISVGGYKLLATGTATSSSLTIASGETCALTTTSASKTGYTPIGVIGYDINGSGMSNINIFKMYISGSNVAFRVRNNYTSSWTGTITFYVLYISSSQGV